MSFCVLDCNKCEAYPLPAGLHCQSVLADRDERSHQDYFF
ncbi:hypothetical protein J658_3510 [Acinetobacter baumannii 573719]|nr:hypothetical protein J658_3510 [Acinetobacter baumannii 573719]